MVDHDAERQDTQYDDMGPTELELVAYIGDFKIVGMARVGGGEAAASRRASDHIRQLKDSRLTLSKVRIYARDTQELIETPPFLIVNMDKIDFVFAREDGEPQGA